MDLKRNILWVHDITGSIKRVIRGHHKIATHPGTGHLERLIFMAPGQLVIDGEEDGQGVLRAREPKIINHEVMAPGMTDGVVLIDAGKLEPPLEMTHPFLERCGAKGIDEIPYFCGQVSRHERR